MKIYSIGVLVEINCSSDSQGKREEEEEGLGSTTHFKGIVSVTSSLSNGTYFIKVQ